MLHLIVGIAIFVNKEPYTRYMLALIIAIGMSLKGYKKKSLSKSGAITAFIVCYIIFRSSYRFGLTLLNFYITSSKLTKV